MKLSTLSPSQTKHPVETLMIFTDKEAKKLLGPAGKFDRTLAGKFASAFEKEKAAWKERQSLVFHPADSRPARTVIVIGLGEQQEGVMESMRRAAARGAQRARELQSRSLHVLLPHDVDSESTVEDVAHTLTEGIILGLYEFKKYKSENHGKGRHPETVTLCVADAAEARRGTETGQWFAEAACLTRDLINEPAMVMTPSKLADTARQTARTGIKATIYDERTIKKMGMGGLLGVAAGSAQPPRFVHLAYKSPKAAKTVAIVGKGITFDSGGLCIKTPDGMLTMKDDMSGAAVIVGIFSALSRLKPPVNVHGIFAATENMPGGRAYKMGDVLKALNGKTMEIVNTDAEGRLVLADALSYASRLKPDEIIDLATLTGACVVALGPEIAGVFSNDRDLANRLVDAGKVTGEKLWPMPLEHEYKSMIKSPIADMKNSGGRWGGAITAALFLNEFVGKDIPWAHVDIAGPAYTETARHYMAPGATGAMVRTLLQYLREV